MAGEKDGAPPTGVGGGYISRLMSPPSLRRLTGQPALSTLRHQIKTAFNVHSLSSASQHLSLHAFFFFNNFFPFEVTDTHHHTTNSMSIRIIPQVRSPGDKKNLLGCKTWSKTFFELSLGVTVVGGVSSHHCCSFTGTKSRNFFFILSVTKGF